MSKTKLAILVFCVAFGVNILAFVFSKKTYIIEEVKNVWLYELPPTLSPLDAAASPTFGPHQGVIGTLFLPGGTGEIVEGALAGPWSWDQKTRELRLSLRPGLTYSDGTSITAQDWVASLHWAQAQSSSLRVSPEWAAFATLQASAPDAQTLIFKWESLPAGFDLMRFAQQVLTHPLSGVFHPSNLARLKAGEPIVKGWISSGPYTVRKWKPKEISIASRDSFPIQLPKEFFRTLRYQSAPVKNPSCDFMQGNATETAAAATGKVKATDKDLQEHSVVPTAEEVHVFWLCRSWKQADRFCADPARRKAFGDAIAGKPAAALQGKTVEYRIPTGSDPFRAEFRRKIETAVAAAGGQAKEVSYFFKSSAEADIELGFAVTPAGPQSSELAARWMELSSRLGAGASAEKDVVGEVFKFPMMVLMKRIQGGDPFKKVFLEPDLEEKKLPL